MLITLKLEQLEQIWQQI